MSASLVGSEMCIRDRQETAFKNSTRSVPKALRASDADSWHFASSRSNDPVSYTHLTLPTICSV
eukprot:945028-Alexandrium_andersonii.AAC.1